MMDSPLLIGVDNATDGPTGICIARYHPVRGAAVLETKTLSTRRKIIKYFDYLAETYTPLAFATEGGFVNKRYFRGKVVIEAKIGLSVERQGGFFEGIAMDRWPKLTLKNIRHYEATQWRTIFRGCGRMTSSEWKDYVLRWASVEPLIKDEHQADALGILSKLGQHLTEEGIINA